MVVMSNGLASDFLCPPGFRCGSEGGHEGVDRRGTEFRCGWHRSHCARAHIAAVLPNAERVHRAVNKAWCACWCGLPAREGMVGGKGRVGGCRGDVFVGRVVVGVLVVAPVRSGGHGGQAWVNGNRRVRGRGKDSRWPNSGELGSGNDHVTELSEVDAVRRVLGKQSCENRRRRWGKRENHAKNRRVVEVRAERVVVCTCLPPGVPSARKVDEDDTQRPQVCLSGRVRLDGVVETALALG
jgi:hypothetical protein